MEPIYSAGFFGLSEGMSVIVVELFFALSGFALGFYWFRRYLPTFIVGLFGFLNGCFLGTLFVVSVKTNHYQPAIVLFDNALIENTVCCVAISQSGVLDLYQRVLATMELSDLNGMDKYVVGEFSHVAKKRTHYELKKEFLEATDRFRANFKKLLELKKSDGDFRMSPDPNGGEVLVDGDLEDMVGVKSSQIK
jgi:hypothetical protein